MIRAGFIGFGRMGITHYSILNSHPDVKVAAVCDQSTAMLNIIKKYLDVATYSDYGKMLAEARLFCFVISTPGDSHAEVMQAAVERNLHVFVEKPFTMTMEEGEKAVDAIEGKALVNQVGYVNRFNEVFMEIKKLVDSGVIGEIKTFSSEMYGATVLKDSKSGWRSKRKTGGGCMYEFASHCIDLAVYLFGQPDRVAGSVMESIYSSEVEDFVASTFIYDKGYAGTITCNWSDESYRKPANIVKVFGTKGRIVADKHAFRVYLRDADQAHGFDKGWNTRYITDFARSVRFYLRGNEFTRQLDYFVDCIKEKRQDNVAGFAEGLKTDRVMDWITRDAEQAHGEENAGETPAVRAPDGQKQSVWKRLVG